MFRHLNRLKTTAFQSSLTRSLQPSHIVKNSLDSYKVFQTIFRIAILQFNKHNKYEKSGSMLFQTEIQRNEFWWNFSPLFCKVLTFNGLGH